MSTGTSPTTPIPPAAHDAQESFPPPPELAAHAVATAELGEREQRDGVLGSADRGARRSREPETGEVVVPLEVVRVERVEVVVPLEVGVLVPGAAT